MRPGNYEIVMNDTTLRELVYDVAGGFRPGHDFKAAWVGGSSVNVVGAEALDTPLDYESLAAAGTSLGSRRLHRDGRLRLASCAPRCAWRTSTGTSRAASAPPAARGRCWLERILQRIVDGEGRMEDLELIESLAERIDGRVLCALADTGILPVAQRRPALPRRLRARHRGGRRSPPGAR